MKIRYACEYNDSILERHISICQNKIYATRIFNTFETCFLLQDSEGHVHIRMIQDRAQLFLH